MKDEHRKKLNNRLTPLHLYKLTPKTNCGECGFASCLAFSTQVIVGQADLEACSHLDQQTVEAVREHLDDQHRAGIGLKREGFEKALQFLRQEVRKCDFRNIAQSLGATLEERNGEPVLTFPYFGEPVQVTYEDISNKSEGELSPWEKILLYNYIIGGAAEPSGVWVGMESLPNSVSKIKSLKNHCEIPLAVASAGKMDRLPSGVSPWGLQISVGGETVDFAAEFHILPSLSVRVLWWDEDKTEGFQAQTKFIFDSRVMQILDLESLIFACEQVTERLVDALR